jgi:hypothetical protein
MSLPVVLRDEAQAEFDKAFDFYEGRQPGLGVTFAARVQEVFYRIASNPSLHPVVFADIRKAVVRPVPIPRVLSRRADARAGHRRLPQRAGPGHLEGLCLRAVGSIAPSSNGPLCGPIPLSHMGIGPHSGPFEEARPHAMTSQSLSAVTPGQSSVRKGVTGRPARL